MSVTDELNELIALHGNARDALNVTLAKLRQAQSEIAVLKEAAQQGVQADGDCPYCQYPSFDEGGKLLDHCAACSRPRS